MRSPRLRIMGRDVSRRAVAAGSGALVAFLIVGGIAFASQSSRQNEHPTVAAPPSLTTATAPGNRSTTGSVSQGPVVGLPGSTPGNGATTPTTSVGATTASTTPVVSATTTGMSTPTTLPSTEVTVSSTTSTSTVASTQPLETTTTVPKAPSNGPQMPSVQADLASGSNPEDPHVYLRISAGDTDGRISQIVIDWDDNGEQTAIPFTYDSCPTVLTSSQAATSDHDYVDAGTHNITVTVTSTDCAGGGVQQSIAVIPATTGGLSTSGTSSS